MDQAATRVFSRISFDRRELNHIFSIYGRMVAAGEWRDYAFDALSDCALFSVYRRASEQPLFLIEKRPDNARRQGEYAVLSGDGRVLRRGRDLAQVLRVMEPKRLRVVD